MKETKTSHFIQNIIALLLSQMMIKFLGMIYSLYLTNKSGFGDKGNAIFYSAYQVYVIFLTISSIGIPNSISKIIAEELAIGNIKESKRILKLSLLIFGSLGLICSLVLYAFSSFIANSILNIEEVELVLKLLAPSIFWITLTSIFRGYFNGKRKIKISARIQTIEQILKTMITLILVEFIAKLTNYNTELMVVASTVSLVLASMLGFGCIVINFYKNERNEKNEYLYSNDKLYMSIREIFTKIMYISIPITISAFLVSISKNIDSFSIMRLLGKIFSENEVKERYGILSSKVELLTIFPMALNGSVALAIIPEISRINRLNKYNNMKKSVNFSILLTFLVSIPFMCIMFMYSNEIICFLYPNANKGGDLLRISSLSIVCLCLIQTLNGILQGLRKNRYLYKSNWNRDYFKTYFEFLFNSNKRNL